LRDTQCGARCGGDRLRQGCRVDVAARALQQQLDQRLGAGHEGSEGAEGFAEGADEHGSFLRGKARELHGAPPAGAQHADSMRVIDDQPRIVCASGIG
jgi:hypothetical protein